MAARGARAVGGRAGAGQVTVAGRAAPAAGVAAAAVAVALLAALPYLAAGVSPGFINLDDPEYVTANPLVRQGLGWAAVRWALTGIHAGYWHPVTWLSHMLDVTLFGLDARGHHATSILLHAVTSALLFLALLRLTGAAGRSALAAALFGAHPLRVESVAWVAERKDVLAGLFFMLVLLAWEGHARRRGRGRYLAALALFALGLAAKPTLVTLPFVLLLLDFWPLGRLPLPAGRSAVARWGRPLLEKAPFLALAAAFSAVTALTQRGAGALPDLKALPLATRAANALLSVVAYLRATAWPVDLAVYYPYPSAISPWLAGAAGAALLAATVAALTPAVARLRPFLTVGWCWFIGMLVPMSGVVQAGLQARADRHTYLPHAGLILGAVWLAAAYLPPPARRPGTRWALAATLAAACAVASTVQAGYWRDSETLFRRTLAVTGDNVVIRTNLGNALSALGREEEAVGQYREVLRIQPGSPEARYNIGISLAALGRHGEAVAEYREAVRSRPDFLGAHYNLGISLAALGRHEEAVAHYRAALGLAPDLAEARTDLGLSLAALGRHGEAIREFRDAVRIDPGDVRARRGLNGSLAALGRGE